VVCGNRNYGATIALIGEAPGREEDRLGTPFAGSAGAVLDQFLADSGIDRNKLYITNTVKCRPFTPSDKGGRNRKPKQSEIEACRPFLMAEMLLMEPKLIVTLGATPLSVVLGKAPKMADEHGKLHTWDLVGGIEVFPLYHPAALIYDRSKTAAYQQDMQNLRRLLTERGLI
jgi:DNA polymerase